jgi:hypothetical protein
MLSGYLVRIIEQHAEDLTKELLDDLQSNPRTPSFRQLSREELHERMHDLYKNLGLWLAHENEAAIETMYAEIGRRRAAQGVPISEVVCALGLVKEHLRNFVRRVDFLGSAFELHREVELNTMVGHFFDRAVYFTVKGYEAARLAGASGDVAANHPLRA